ncbi:MAG TPA: L,D-transpeptidase [Chitinophagaceae bacterium]|nr:L,D-transpeptidase [Chitinophagaceae bacterium]
MKNLFVLTSLIFCSSFFASGLGTDSHRLMTHKRLGSDGPIGTTSLLIDKSDYELSLYDDKGWYATYPVVFGNASLADKKMEGDKNTPEGVFHINSKRIHEKWYRFLGIDYPTKESWEKFNQRKERGEIPSTARIGGSIGIHGTWPHEDFVVDRYKNWTLGCISMKREDVDEIFNFSPVGTKVTIRK